MRLQGDHFLVQWLTFNFLGDSEAQYEPKGYPWVVDSEELAASRMSLPESLS